MPFNRRQRHVGQNRRLRRIRKRAKWLRPRHRILTLLGLRVAHPLKYPASIVAGDFKHAENRHDRI